MTQLVLHGSPDGRSHSRVPVILVLALLVLLPCLLLFSFNSLSLAAGEETPKAIQGASPKAGASIGIKELTKRAEGGDASAQVDLGLRYERGKGVKKDFTAAVKWFRRAAEQGNAHGQNNLGSMYAKGHGVPKDRADAIKWYKKAADQGNEAAKKNLRILGVSVK